MGFSAGDAAMCCKNSKELYELRNRIRMGRSDRANKPKQVVHCLFRHSGAIGTDIFQMTKSCQWVGGMEDKKTVSQPGEAVAIRGRGRRERSGFCAYAARADTGFLPTAIDWKRRPG